MYKTIADLNIRELNKQGVEVRAFTDTEDKRKQRWYATLDSITGTGADAVSTSGAEATVLFSMLAAGPILLTLLAFLAFVVTSFVWTASIQAPVPRIP